MDAHSFLGHRRRRGYPGYGMRVRPLYPGQAGRRPFATKAQRRTLFTSNFLGFQSRHITTVRRWISRVKIDGNIHDQKRDGRPSAYSEKIKLETIAFYCQVSPLPDWGTWSFRWAEKYLKEHSESSAAL